MGPGRNSPPSESGKDIDFQLVMVIVFASDLFVSVIGDLGNEIAKAVLLLPATSKLVEYGYALHLSLYFLLLRKVCHQVYLLIARYTIRDKNVRNSSEMF
ncbi:MAG: hypothetical protein R2750_02510 [Bacteroidales bacterium]